LSFLGLLFLLDYYFTLLNYRLYQVKMKSFVETEHFELNPEFQKDVYAGKYRIVHALRVLLILLALFGLHAAERIFGPVLGFIGLNESMYLLSVATLLSAVLLIIFQHVRGLLLFRTFNRIPNLVSGHIMHTYRFDLESSKSEALAMTMVFVVVFIISPSVVTMGLALGPLLMFFQFQYWIKLAATKVKISQ